MKKNNSMPPMNEPFSPLQRPSGTEEEQQAEKFKAAGNAQYQAHNYVQACQLYSNAIQLSPENPVYYLNRAKCFK